ncbi:MAG TPA: mobile mystery protein A [Frankiaceae bacterium]|jgi:predicted DNA-binding mobile mystery protein A|nr:mobile mystery protein A [Frankiaceae bacterium]
MTAERALRARRALDRRLDVLPPAASLQPPHDGWVRAIRDALGMSLADLGQRMGIAAQSVAALEAAERSGGIKLDSLRRAADALDCDLAYVLLPRHSLEATVRKAAVAVVEREAAAVQQTMRLEDQDTVLDDTALGEAAQAVIRSGRTWK